LVSQEDYSPTHRASVFTRREDSLKFCCCCHRLHTRLRIATVASQPEDYCSIHRARPSRSLFFKSFLLLSLPLHTAEDCWYPSQRITAHPSLSSRGEKTCFLSFAAVATRLLHTAEVSAEDCCIPARGLLLIQSLPSSRRVKICFFGCCCHCLHIPLRIVGIPARGLLPIHRARLQ
jgi:hypothetical protein